MASKEIEVIRVPGGINADSIVAALHGSGIPARLHGEPVGAIYGLTLDGLGEVSIFVPAEYAEQAREVLAAAADGQLLIEENETGDQADPERS